MLKIVLIRQTNKNQFLESLRRAHAINFLKARDGKVLPKATKSTPLIDQIIFNYSKHTFN